MNISVAMNNKQSEDTLIFSQYINGKFLKNLDNNDNKSILDTHKQMNDVI